MARYLSFAFSILLFSTMAFPQAFCPRIFTTLSSRGSDAKRFWERTTAYKIGEGRGAQPFKFGFDAELWRVQDSLSIIAQHEPTWNKLARKLDREGPFYSLSEIASMLGVSETTAKRSLYAGVDKEDGQYVLTDIKLEKLYAWDHHPQVKSDYAEVLWRFVDASLKAQRIPISAKLETDSGHASDMAVELVMNGAKSSPAEFKKLIDWLYDTVDAPETHYHVSVPKKHIDSDRMIFAARALETKILLDQILTDRDYTGETYAPHDNTSFSVNIAAVRDQDFPQVERGIVRVDSERWANPKAHDIEIRDWIDKNHAFENMHFMMELSRHSERLRDSSHFQASELRNTMPPNLNGALRYAAYILEERLPANKRHIAQELTAMASRMESSGYVSDSARHEAAAYLKQHNVLKYLTLETFLEPEE